MFAQKQVNFVYYSLDLKKKNLSRKKTFFRIKLLKNTFFTGLFAIRAERDYVLDEDFMKAVRKIADNKKLETKLDYKPV